jgi:hypothetical protein
MHWDTPTALILHFAQQRNLVSYSARSSMFLKGHLRATAIHYTKVYFPLCQIHLGSFLNMDFSGLSPQTLNLRMKPGNLHFSKLPGVAKVRSRVGNRHYPAALYSLPTQCTPHEKTPHLSLTVRTPLLWDPSREDRTNVKGQQANITLWNCIYWQSYLYLGESVLIFFVPTWQITSNISLKLRENLNKPVASLAF